MTKGYRSNRSVEVAGYTQEVAYTSFTQQNLAANVDTVLTFSSPTGLSPNELINHLGSGVIEIVKAIPFMFKTRARLGRAGNPGVANLFLVVELDVTGSWTKIGFPVDYKLNTDNEVDVFFDLTPELFPLGTKLRIVGRISNTGANDGFLAPSTPDAGMLTDGWLAAPSYQLTVYRANDYD